jgi:hypothetical protein
MNHGFELARDMEVEEHKIACTPTGKAHGDTAMAVLDGMELHVVNVVIISRD